MEEISHALQSAAAIGQIAKTTLATGKNVKSNEIAIELQGHIIDLQTQLGAAQLNYSELIRIKDEAEQKLIDYENWENEKDRYELRKIGDATYVYGFKVDDEFPDPPHWICPNCYEDRKKSILQTLGPDTICHRCGFRVLVGCSPGAEPDQS